jgi:hypothetical protein
VVTIGSSSGVTVSVVVAELMVGSHKQVGCGLGPKAPTGGGRAESDHVC